MNGRVCKRLRKKAFAMRETALMVAKKQKIDVKSDSNIRISWEDNQDNLIDVSVEEIQSSNDK